ncbi:MAG TPA: hypothetical protein VGB37_03835 [Candidatus Lokiarchaeia archaeon]
MEYFKEKVNFKKYVGNHTLLYGENNTKKSYYTAKFVQFLIETKKVSPISISILDFAPKSQIIDNKSIGGKLEDYYENITICCYYKVKGEIIPPRLNATNQEELYSYACHNYKLTLELLKNYNKNTTPVLIINDISIYLHLGNKNYLIETIDQSETFFGNAYYGKSINKSFTKLFSLKERVSIEYLIKKVDFALLTQG